MKCAQCQVEKPESDFSKSQLKKGSDAKCSTCSAAAAASTTASNNEASTSPSAPSTKVKTCSQCKRTGCQFSKAQMKKEDGKCVDCVQSAEAGNVSSKEQPASANASDQSTKSPRAESQPKSAQASNSTEASSASSPRAKEMKSSNTARSGSPQPQDDDDSIRICCESCQVFKPKASFPSNSEFCVVCMDAKKKGIRQTTMKDHGLVASDGSSHRRLSWVPENLKEYLAFMDQESKTEQEDDDAGEGGDDEEAYE